MLLKTEKSFRTGSPLAAVVAVAPEGRGTGVSAKPTLDEQSLLYPETVVPCYQG